MSGGKGGSQTTEVKVPEYIQEAGKANLARADELAKIGYTPYYGPDVAAFSPMQQASFQNTADTASAFGLSAPTSQRDIMGGMPAPTQYAGGVSGYSSAPMYEQSVATLARERPGQYKAMMEPFIDPVTGREPAAPFGNGSTAGKGGPSSVATAAAKSPLLQTYSDSSRVGYVDKPYYYGGQMYPSKAAADRARDNDRGR